MKRFIWLFTLALLGQVTTSFAAVPSKINLQGRLTDSNVGLNGQHAAVFRLYDALTSGNLLWTENQSLEVDNGLFTTVLGQNNPFTASTFSGQMLWLETQVDGTALSPRQPFVSVPYAFYSQRADTANVALSGTGGNELWSTDGTNVWRPGGNVGIGAPSPSHPLEVLSGSPGQVGYFHSTSPSGTNYGMDAGAQGAGATTNIGGYFYASGAANNYALIVPSGYGNVGIGTGSPLYQLDVHSTNPLQGLNWTVDYGSEIGSYVRFGTNNARGAMFIGNANVGGSYGPDEGALLQTTGGWQWNKQLNIMGRVGINTNNPTAMLTVGGDAYISGNLTVSGTKCRVVTTDSGELKMNAVESAHALFMDEGASAYLVNGQCRVNLARNFIATVTANSKYKLIVNITFYGRHGGDWYVERDESGFTVIDPAGSNAEFSWEVKARQRGYEDTYLEPVIKTAAR